MRGVVREGPGRGQCAETRVTSWSRRTGLGTLCARGGRTAVSKAPSARARAAGSGPAGGGSRAPGVQGLWEQPAALGPQRLGAQEALAGVFILKVWRTLEV